jgi:hypothetical protein
LLRAVNIWHPVCRPTVGKTHDNYAIRWRCLRLTNMQARRQLWVKGCRRDHVGSTSDVPETPDDTHRVGQGRQPWANYGHRLDFVSANLCNSCSIKSSRAQAAEAQLSDLPQCGRTTSKILTPSGKLEANWEPSLENSKELWKDGKVL